MSAKKVFLTGMLLLALVSLAGLTACQPSIPAQALGVEAENLSGEINVAFDYEQAADVMAYRWNAMAQEYKRLGLLNYKTNPDDVIAYRWNAMAQEYKRLGLLNSRTHPDDVLAYRWLAMAKFYERNGLLNEHSR
jgi:hypothetical protein